MLPFGNNMQDRKINFSHLNIQSITNKVHELKHYLATNNIGIMSINETWLTPNTQLAIPNYNIERCDRINDRQGEGVCLIKNN